MSKCKLDCKCKTKAGVEREMIDKFKESVFDTLNKIERKPVFDATNRGNEKPFSEHMNEATRCITLAMSYVNELEKE